MKTYLEARSNDDSIPFQQAEITEGIVDEEGKSIDPQTAMDSMVATQMSMQANKPLLGGKVQPAPEVKYYKHICYHDEVPVRTCELIEVDPETMEPVEE